MASQSEELRKKGNEFVTSINDKTLGTSVKLYRLQEAIKLYNRALNASHTDDQKASCNKNLCCVAFKYSRIVEEDDQKLAIWYLQESVRYCHKAFLCGASKTKLWRDKLKILYEEIVEYAVDFICQKMQAEDDTPYYKAVDKLYKSALTHISRARFQLCLAQKYFHLGVCHHTASNYAGCLRYMAECYTPLELAEQACRRAGGNEEQETEIRVLREDIRLTTLIAESGQARLTGDNLMESLLKDNESLNMDQAWEVADWYKKAILSTRGNEVESEAMALCRLGVLYDKVFKLRYYSKPCFRRVIQLGLTMTPRNVTNESWYLIANQTLAQYQRELQTNDAKIEAEKHQKLLQEIPEEVAKLDKLRNLDTYSMLTGIYRDFPPKNSKHKFKCDDPKDRDLLKKALKKAIVRYHPDNAAKRNERKHWAALCLEISKVLTSAYNCFK